MALRRTLSKRLFNKSRESAAVTLKHSPIASQSLHETLAPPPNEAKINFHREFLTSPDSSDSGFFRRFLHRATSYQASSPPESLSVPVGEKLKEKLCSMNLTGDRFRLDGLSPPLPSRPRPLDSVGGISVHDVKKIMRSTQLEKLRAALRQIPTNSISYSEFVQTCADVCSNREQGAEYAKKLDESGNVIVLGNIVFLRPEQVAKSMEKVISNSIGIPNDPRRKELEQMEKEKAAIDQKAQQLVRGELYCGLGFLAVQTLGFMRLTFWELSWDVMEPICFFVTSLHFALAYAFFLRTSTEPTFEGYFQCRFKAKQKNLMKTHNFDLDKYNELCRAFYPNYGNSKDSDQVGEAAFGALNRT